jgi:valyl-tRNA synthetase
MALQKRYNPASEEPKLDESWQNAGIYRFKRGDSRAVYSVDTPPATVSGFLHLGHVYSYSHTDFIVRFQRMRGFNVFYPMGYDDNGLPTERLVEKRFGVTAEKVGRQAFIDKCLAISEEAEAEYEQLWRRLGLSVDWHYTYRTIDDNSRRISQLSFLELYKKGLVYRQEAPAIWCPECKAAFAQADLNDLERTSEFITIPFAIEGQADLRIATTRPELLPACVAIFVHPEDERYANLVGQHTRVPLFNQSVPILADPQADPHKGTGAVMCCTFGDQTDVAWWNRHHLPTIQAIDEQGNMTEAAGEYAGLPVEAARKAIKHKLAEADLLLESHPIQQSIRVHERCDTPVEYIIVWQWFVRLLDHKEQLLEAGRKVHWHPEHMQARYQSWVENLSWDWCISRQRFFGVPFPLWYCTACGEVILAQEDQLPVDPLAAQPQGPCPNCGSTSFEPEKDIMDTWATSSMSPQISGNWLCDPELYNLVFPMSLRPQAHGIIRTWAFYTITKSLYHFDVLPWQHAMISGWGIAGEGMEKISKSRGGGPMPPLEMIDRYSADAVRYWAASTGMGKDAVINEDKIQMGAKLVTKLWNVARFSARFLEGFEPSEINLQPVYTAADRWMLARLQRLIQYVTDAFEAYDYAAAKNELELFFWNDLADNYLEMAKQRLYAGSGDAFEAARQCLYQVLLATTKLFAPILPFITERIYLDLYAGQEKQLSVHCADWPVVNPHWVDDSTLAFGETLVEIATSVRRYKSEHNLSLGSPIKRLQLATGSPQLQAMFLDASADLSSITRADEMQVVSSPDRSLVPLSTAGEYQVFILPG